MPQQQPTPEPAQTLAFDLVRAHLDGSRATIATLLADASQDPGRLIAVLSSIAELAVTFGRRAHGDDLREHLTHGLAHTLDLAPLPEHPRAGAAADLDHRGQHRSHGGTA